MTSEFLQVQSFSLRTVYALKRRVQVRIGDAMQALSGHPMVHSATLPVTPGSGGLPWVMRNILQSMTATHTNWLPRILVTSLP